MIVRSRSETAPASRCPWCGEGPLLVVECPSLAGRKCAECQACGAHLVTAMREGPNPQRQHTRANIEAIPIRKPPEGTIA
jgi:hypothetical protein